MKIHELKIAGFKSIGEITLVEPNPFSVFVGPNGAGKSNIFEALELMQLCNIMSPREALRLFGNIEDTLTRHLQLNQNPKIEFVVDAGKIKPTLKIHIKHLPYIHVSESHMEWLGSSERPEHKQFSNFTRLFSGEQKRKVKINLQDDSRLASDASNVEKVLKRIIQNKNIKDEIVEILHLLVPGFHDIDISTNELSGSDDLIIYESALKKPLTRNLISDGTYNIIALLTAVFQSEEPQFLCIEEPENGLNPKVVQLLVDLFRDKCEENGHYIWLNTHSQSLVSQLTPDEIILVDKVDELTQTKQVKGKNLHGLPMDEALFSNVLGGGIPW